MSSFNINDYIGGGGNSGGAGKADGNYARPGGGGGGGTPANPFTAKGFKGVAARGYGHARWGYGQNRKDIDWAVRQNRTGWANLADGWGDLRGRYDDAIGANGAGAQRSSYEEFSQNPLFEQSLDGVRRIHDYRGNRNGNLYSGAGGVSRSVAELNAKRGMWNEHLDRLGQAAGQRERLQQGRLGYNDQATGYRVSNRNHLNTQLQSILNAWGNYDSALKAARMQKKAAESSAKWGALGSIGSAALGVGAKALMLSDPEAKDVWQDEMSPTLEAIEDLPLPVWSYKKEVVPHDQGLHTGPMADEWANRFGGDGVTIDQIDVNGVLLRAVQELSDGMKSISNRLEALEGNSNVATALEAEGA